MDQKTITEKGSYGAQVSLLNLMGSVTPFSLLRKLRREFCGEITRNSPHPAYVKLLNFVQLTSAEALSSDRDNKWKRRKVNKGRKRINIYILFYVNKASNTVSFKNGGK